MWVLIPESGRSPIGENGNPLQYSQGTEEIGGLQSMGLQRVGDKEATEHKTHIDTKERFKML